MVLQYRVYALVEVAHGTSIRSTHIFCCLHDSTELGGSIFDFIGSEVGCHDENRVLAVNYAVFRVRDTPVVEYLQEYRQNVGVRLFDLV